MLKGPSLANACAFAVARALPAKGFYPFWANFKESAKGWLQLADYPKMLMAVVPGQQGMPCVTWLLPWYHRPSFSWNDLEIPWKSSWENWVNIVRWWVSWQYALYFLSPRELHLSSLPPRLAQLGAGKACGDCRIGPSQHLSAVVLLSCCSRMAYAVLHLPGPVVIGISCWVQKAFAGQNTY